MGERKSDGEDESVPFSADESELGDVETCGWTLVRGSVGGSGSAEERAQQTFGHLRLSLFARQVLRNRLVGGLWECRARGARGARKDIPCVFW